jgi:hypothetical protein
MATDSYEPAIAAQWEDNKQRIREQLIHEFDNATHERKDRRVCRLPAAELLRLDAPLHAGESYFLFTDTSEEFGLVLNGFFIVGQSSCLGGGPTQLK